MDSSAYERFEGSEGELRAHLADSAVPVVLAVTSSDARSCESAAEVLRRASSNVGERASIVHADASSCAGLLAEFQVSTVPALLALENGGMVAQHVGVLEEGDVIHVLGLDLWRESGDEESVKGLF